MKKYLYRLQRDSRSLLTFQLVMFSLGVLMVLFITRAFSASEHTYGSLGTMTSIFGIIYAAIPSNGDLSLYVSMGDTRKHFILGDCLLALILTIQSMVTFLLLGAAEEALYHVLLPGWTNEVPVLEILSHAVTWKAVLLIPLLILPCRLFNVSFYMRFGQQVSTFIYLGLVIFCAIIPAAVSSYRNGSTSILAKITGFFVENIPSIGWTIIGILLLAAMAVGGYLYLRRVEVRT